MEIPEELKQFDELKILTENVHQKELCGPTEGSRTETRPTVDDSGSVERRTKQAPKS